MGKRFLLWIKNHRPSRRRLIQLYAALLMNAHVRGFLDGKLFTGISKSVCTPGLNCYSCPGAIAACPLGALQNALAASGKTAPWFAMGILMLYGLILGRTICGWLCPFGLIQELLHKIPTPKVKKSKVTRAFSWLKYVVLGVLVIGLPLYKGLQGEVLPAFCKILCPAGTLEGSLVLLSHPDNSGLFSSLGFLFTRKFVILMLILLACVFLYRAFCRFLCPLGAIYSFFSGIAVTGIRVREDRCVSCGKCVALCPVDIRHIGDRECIQCGICADVCPTKAIRFQFGKWVLSPSEKTDSPKAKRPFPKKTLAVICLSLLLIAALVYANDTPEDAGNNASQDEIAAEQIGLDFSVPLYGKNGGRFVLSEHRGQVIVVNFWATWCPSCVKELPCFERLSEDYGGEVCVIAIHSQLTTEDVESFIQQKGYRLPMAYDEQGDVITRLGGSNQLPFTVIMDREGKIVYQQAGSMDDEKLRSLVEPLL